MNSRFDNIEVSMTFNAREIALLYALTGHSCPHDLDQALEETASKDHTKELFESVSTNSNQPAGDEPLNLYNKFLEEFNKIRHSTVPEVITIYYYIALSNVKNNKDVFVSLAFDSYEAALENFNMTKKHNHKLIEIVTKEVTR